MAVEARRGCGFRKINGLYLVGGGLSAPCDRMPYRLDRCPTCGEGVKFTRGHSWLQPDFFPVLVCTNFGENQWVVTPKGRRALKEWSRS